MGGEESLMEKTNKKKHIYYTHTHTHTHVNWDIAYTSKGYGLID